MAARELLDVHQSAERLNTTVRHIRRLIAEKRIRHYKLGPKVRIAGEDLDAFAEQGRVEPEAS